MDFYSERAVGNHYAANDMTLFKLALYYVQQTGDFAFVDEQVSGRPVLQWMADFALAYRNLSSPSSSDGTIDSSSDGGVRSHVQSDVLADYGDASALLECVPTYQHKVRSRRPLSHCA